MTSEPTSSAAEVYEIVLEDTGGNTTRLQMAIGFVAGLFTRGHGDAAPDGAIISVRRISSGKEVFRHIEDMGDAHVLEELEEDLAAMTAAEFESRWLN